jgi:hypothetical protein
VRLGDGDGGGHVHFTASSSEEKVKGTQFVVKGNVEKLRHCFCIFFFFKSKIWKLNVIHEGKRFATFCTCAPCMLLHSLYLKTNT